MKAATLAHKRGLLKALVLETKKLIYTQEDLPVLPPSKPAIPSLKESAKSQPTLYTPQPAETKPIENVIKKSPIEKKSIFDLEKLISKQLNDSSHILSFFKHFFPEKLIQPSSNQAVCEKVVILINELSSSEDKKFYQNLAKTISSRLLPAKILTKQEFTSNHSLCQFDLILIASDIADSFRTDMPSIILQMPTTYFHEKKLKMELWQNISQHLSELPR